MRIFIADIPTLDTAFDASLAANSRAVETFLMRGTKGLVYVVEVTLPNPGLALLAPGQPRFALVSWSPTNNASDAVPFARGRYDGVPSSLSGRLVTLRVVCAPEDIDARLAAEASALRPAALYATAASNGGAPKVNYGPYDDHLFPGWESPREQVLAARGATWHVDPLTHAIALTDEVEGRRVVDLYRLYDRDSVDISLRDGEPPAKRYKMKVIAEWDQVAKGFCDISNRLNGADPRMGGWIGTLDQQVQVTENPQQGGQVDFGSMGGWIADAHLAEAKNFKSVYVESGQKYEVVFERYWHRPVYLSGVWQYRTYVLDTFTREYNEMISFAYLRYRYRYYHMQYDYQQPRREEATMVLDYGTAPIATALEEVELPEIALGDLQYPLDLEPWSPSRAYDVGDEVLYAGAAYRATTSHAVGEPFLQLRSRVKALGGGTFKAVHPGWERIPHPAAMPDARQPSFFDTQRGESALEHAALRMVAEARRRSLYMRVRLRFAWSRAHHVRLDDSVRVEIKGADGTLQPVIGKVEEILWSWSARAATVEMTLAVPLGDGRDETGAARLGVYVEDYADEYGEGDGLSGVTTISTTASTLLTPVDAYRLGDPSYAVQQIVSENQAMRQLTLAKKAYGKGRDPREVVDENPTRIRVEMRPLEQYDALVRTYAVDVRALKSPRGIDLFTGGEP